MSLEYDDPLVPLVDVATVISRAHRIRRRRRAVAGTALALISAATVVLPTAVPTGKSRPAPNPAAQLGEDPLLLANPPVGAVRVLSRSPQHWTTVAWVTRSGGYCRAAFRTPMQGGTKSGLCTGRVDGLFSTTEPNLFMKPLFDALPPVSSGNTIGVGLVRGPVTTVDVTIFGRTVTAAVVPLVVRGAVLVGGYAVELPLGGRTGYGWEDITSVVARDASGRILARLP